MAGKLVLIIGPSGVGKSVILNSLRQTHAEWHFPRSATTRPRRAGEGDELYHFMNDAQFDEALGQNRFLEWAEVHGGARYGTLREEILPQIDAGKTVVREVDVQGFESISGDPLFSGAQPRYTLQSIFLLPESPEQIIAHIQKRAPMAEEELKRRLKSMQRELTFAQRCTHRVVSVEGHLDAVTADVEKLILG